MSEQLTVEGMARTARRKALKTFCLFAATCLNGGKTHEARKSFFSKSLAASDGQQAHPPHHNPSALTWRTADLPM
jgi:hypothetical protein